MTVKQDGADQDGQHLPHEFSTHRIMSALLSIFLVLGIANIWYNKNTLPSASGNDQIPAVTTEYNETKTVITKDHCDQLQKKMTHNQVLAMLGMPTMKTVSENNTTGMTEIWQYQYHKNKTIQACTIIFIKGALYSKSWVNFADGFVVR